MFSSYSINLQNKIALPGFEPGSQGPEPCILDHCTIGLKNNSKKDY